MKSKRELIQQPTSKQANKLWCEFLECSRNNGQSHF